MSVQGLLSLPTSPSLGCGSTTGAQNGTLVNGAEDSNLRFSDGIILNHTHLAKCVEMLKHGREHGNA